MESEEHFNWILKSIGEIRANISKTDEIIAKHSAKENPNVEHIAYLERLQTERRTKYHNMLELLYLTIIYEM